ncbi:MAG: lysylphosphatidylglycerol synthase transmembrane domain-containing protein [Oryzomonas sp.]|uniref:lysylphosphatidylglycerol synthase transmembrane domain-containing protein n=1 Tax=Oryzomonas sp. TaxID=2855186 RepID=UPI00284B95F6|nr:lysylphosphatidylglycerol synthase transmembrane domain-containing protein [Oryzomonas sp.]MDR3581459.1 lysylphosphatidylglycerol synthase transmembrane domain-containing protein [Oryzomonas sp.]
MKRTFDLKFWLGIGISVFFMAMLFRKIDFHQLAAALRMVDYRYIALAVVFTFISYFLRAVRWRYLLISEKSISLAVLYPATIIGYMANNLLPARLGEFVRAYVLARREGLETPAVFASLVIDRLFDGFTVLVILLVTLFTLQLPGDMADAETALRAGGVVMFLLYCGVLIFLYLLKRQTMRTLNLVEWLLKPFPQRVAGRLIPLLGSFITGIRLSRRSGHLLAILGSSFLIWTFAVLPVDMTLRGFGIHLPITASMFILVLLVFAVMVPASPGFIGTYHYACYKGLSAFGIADATSVSIALIIHGTAFFPVIIAGFYHLWSGKLNLRNLSASKEYVKG